MCMNKIKNLSIENINFYVYVYIMQRLSTLFVMYIFDDLIKESTKLELIFYHARFLA